MTPRLLLRTHYQVHEPRIIIYLVTRCASATNSRHEEALAASLKAAVLAWKPKLAFGLPPATYALDNARALGFLNSSNRWTTAGLGLGYLASAEPTADDAPSLDLSLAEARLYLTQYLIGTGALALRFGGWLLHHGRTTDEDLGRTEIVEELLVQTLDEYLTLARDARDRTAIRRERDRLRKMRYDEKTRRHKRRPILCTFQRLHLLQIQSDGKTIQPDPDGRLEALIRLIPKTEDLERLATSRDQLREVVSQVYAGDVVSPMPEGDSLRVARAYTFAMGLGLQACPLEFLDDALFMEGVQVIPDEGVGGSAERLLTDFHKCQPRDIRFHVDRRGRRAFVVLSDEGLRLLLHMQHPGAHPLGGTSA